MNQWLQPPAIAKVEPLSAHVAVWYIRAPGKYGFAVPVRPYAVELHGMDPLGFGSS